MKIPSFKHNFKALCALAKSHGHTKRTLSQQQRLMGQGTEEECCPAESLVRLPLKACLVPFLTCILHKYLPSTLTFLKISVQYKCYMGCSNMLIVFGHTCNDICVSISPHSKQNKVQDMFSSLTFSMQGS